MDIQAVIALIPEDPTDEALLSIESIVTYPADNDAAVPPVPAGAWQYDQPGRNTEFRPSRLGRAMGPWPDPVPLVRALGPGWMACAQVLPWQDIDEHLRYVVYSPAYGGTLFICRFQLFSPSRWWHDGHQMGIAGVTHWRLATGADQDFAELDGPLLVTGPRTVPWLRLRHWWSRCRYRLRLENEG